MVMCTQTQVEQRLQINFTDDADVVCAELIAAAQGHIETYLGRPIESATHTETFDGPASTLWLTNRPVSSITTVTVDGTALTDADYTFTEYGRLDRTTGSRVVSWGTYKLQSIDVEYVAGYAPGLIPYALQDVCANVAARAFAAGAAYAAIPAGAEGIKQISLAGSDQVTYMDTAAAVGAESAQLTSEERAVIDLYRGPAIA